MSHFACWIWRFSQPHRPRSADVYEDGSPSSHRARGTDSMELRPWMGLTSAHHLRTSQPLAPTARSLPGLSSEEPQLPISQRIPSAARQPLDVFDLGEGGGTGSGGRPAKRWFGRPVGISKIGRESEEMFESLGNLRRGVFLTLRVKESPS